MRSSLVVPALVALTVAVGGVAVGLSHDDVVTAFGALLFVPSAVLLFGIVLRRTDVDTTASERRRVE